MLYLYKKTTSTGTTIGITEATSERHLAERVLAAIPKDENIIALSGDVLPDGLITLPALMDAVQELAAKEDNAHAADPNHTIEIAGETGLRLAPRSVSGKTVRQMIEKEAADKDACDDCDNTDCPCHPDYEEDEDDEDDCDGDCENCECKDECEEDELWEDEEDEARDSDFLSFLKNAINAYENRHNHNN